MCRVMRFEGEQLRNILMRQSEPVQVLDRFGRVQIEYRRARAAVSLLRLGEYTGTGSKQRIRFIRAESAGDQVTPWGADIDFAPPKGACADVVQKNHTPPGAKLWKPRPDRSGTGRVGKVVQRRIGPDAP